MTPSFRRTSPTITILTWISLGMLAAVVLALGFAASESLPLLVEQHPQLRPLEPLMVTVLFIGGVCVELVLALVALLVAAIHDGRMFDRASLRLVDFLIAVIGAAAVTIAVTIPFLPGPPALGLLAIAGTLVGATTALVLLVLRSLLRRAAAMDEELAEVI